MNGLMKYYINCIQQICRFMNIYDLLDKDISNLTISATNLIAWFKKYSHQL